MSKKYLSTSFLGFIMFILSTNLLSQNCEILDVIWEPIECENGVTYVNISFDYANPGSQGFTISERDFEYGDDYEYGDSLYTFGPVEVDCNTLLTFYITDNENPDCEDHYTYPNIICCDTINCLIADILIDSTHCINDSLVAFQLDLTTYNVGTYFDVLLEDLTLFNTYPYDSLPVYIDSFPSLGGSEILVTVTDSDSMYCGTERQFDNPCFDTLCHIYDVFAEAHACNDDNGFFVDVVFESENVGSEGFEIRGNGVSYGDDFQYGETYYTVGPLIGDCSTLYEFVIIDNENPDCNNHYGFDAPICCGDSLECAIWDILVDITECNDDGSYGLYVNFQYQGTTNDFFDVWAGNEFVGYYSYENLPIHIDTFYGRDAEYDLIRICDNDNDACCAVYEILGPDCGDEEECRIFEVFAEAHECNDNGGFFVDVIFDYDNVGNEGFSIRGNGEIYGDDFEYGETYYTIGPLLGDCETIYEFVVIDNQFDDCGGEFVFEEEICCGEEEACRIFEVYAEASECYDDGGFFVDIEFDFHNVGDEGFTIRGNGEVYGDDFEYGETYYTIGPLLGDCETIYEFVVIDNQFDDCGGEFVFEEEICCGDMMACEIRDIEIDSMSCNDDGSYSLVLNFIVEGNTNEFFDVWAGEEYVGFYRYDDLPVYISNFYP
ncbi:MAG: hypothetical protein KJN84_10060, partial [Bacteroidia bacterium]|nr:hypothetical protein [Bacteroidia bacterium]